MAATYTKLKLNNVYQNNISVTSLNNKKDIIHTMVCVAKTHTLKHLKITKIPGTNCANTTAISTNPLGKLKTYGHKKPISTVAQNS